MSNYKYPYIPKPYFAATMFACKMIQENGYFNKAIDTAASYYNVDRDKLEKHVRARQAAGQKGKKRESGYKLHWYAIQITSNYGVLEGVVKAKNASNAVDRVFEDYQIDFYKRCEMEYAVVILEECSTKEEAEGILEKENSDTRAGWCYSVSCS